MFAWSDKKRRIMSDEQYCEVLRTLAADFFLIHRDQRQPNEFTKKPIDEWHVLFSEFLRDRQGTIVPKDDEWV